MHLWTSTAAVGLVLLIVLPAAPTTASVSPPPAPASVRFLFDLGDGTYAWANATIPNPAATNATWDAVQAAATRSGLWIKWSWYSGSFGSGIFLTDIGNRSPPTVGLFLWDHGNATWAQAPFGVSALVLHSGDVLALADTDYNPNPPYNVYPPAPTPDHAYPAAEFRGDAVNSGSSPSPAPDGLQLLWDRPLVSREIESTPVVVAGRVYVVTMDGMFAVDEAKGTVLWSNPRIKGLSTPAWYNDSLMVAGSDGRVHAVNATSGAEQWNVTLLAKTLFSGITSSPKLLVDVAYLGTFNESGGPGEVVALGAVNGSLLWRHTAPASVSFSSPAVGNRTVFVGVIGKYNTTTQITYNPPYGVLALDAGTGAARWFLPLPASVAASPVLAGSSLFVPAKDGNLYALNPGTGAIRWKAAVAGGVSSPAYHAGTLFVAGGVASFGGSGRVTAVNASTGAAEWTFAPNGAVASSVTYAGGVVLFSTNVANGTIYALDASNGHVAWSFTPTPNQYVFGSPVVADGIVFAPSDNGHLYAIGSPSALVTLNVSAPSTVQIGENVTITATVRAVGGRAAQVGLTMGLRGFQIVSVNMAYTSTAPDTYDWSLGDIPFLGNRTVTILARGACVPRDSGSCSTGTAGDAANVVNYGVTGLRHPDATVYFTVAVTAAPAPASLSWVYVVAPLVIVLAALGIVLFIARRRRQPRGP